VAAVAVWTVPKAEIAVHECVRHHTTFVAIRYNRWFYTTGFKVSEFQGLKVCGVKITLKRCNLETLKH
jgi:hypothetical protein